MMATERNIGIYILLIIFLTLLLSITGCDKAEIVGKVVDQSDNPMESVKISISNSELATQSDKEGNYKIKFLPGKFSLEFEKEGYTSSSINLEIEKESQFPAKKTTLWKIPDSNGLFLFEEGKYIPLADTNVMVKGNLMQTITGIKSPSHQKANSLKPAFIFYGTSYPTDGLFLSKIDYKSTVKVQGIFGSSSQKINLWTANRQKIQLQVDTISSNLHLVQPTEPLSKGNYAFHWGVLYTSDPIELSSMKNKNAYDFTVSSVSEKPKVKTGSQTADDQKSTSPGQASAGFEKATETETNSPDSTIFHDPNIPCEDERFNSNHLAFKLPKDLKWQNTYYSVEFYAILLKSVSAVPDQGHDSAKKCAGYVGEKERKEVQALFPNHKVFASRFGCSDDMVSYSGTNSKYNFLAVYAGATKSEAQKTLEKVKATGKFKGANLRKMKVVYDFGD